MTWLHQLQYNKYAGGTVSTVTAMNYRIGNRWQQHAANKKSKKKKWKINRLLWEEVSATQDDVWED